jgi:hypothetical protein
MGQCETPDLEDRRREMIKMGEVS